MLPSIAVSLYTFLLSPASSNNVDYLLKFQGKNKKEKCENEVIGKIRVGDRSRWIWKLEIHQGLSSGAPADQLLESRPPVDFA